MTTTFLDNYGERKFLSLATEFLQRVASPEGQAVLADPSGDDYYMLSQSQNDGKTIQMMAEVLHHNYEGTELPQPTDANAPLDFDISRDATPLRLTNLRTRIAEIGSEDFVVGAVKDGISDGQALFPHLLDEQDIFRCYLGGLARELDKYLYQYANAWVAQEFTPERIAAVAGKTGSNAEAISQLRGKPDLIAKLIIRRIEPFVSRDKNPNDAVFKALGLEPAGLHRGDPDEWFVARLLRDLPFETDRNPFRAAALIDPAEFHRLKPFGRGSNRSEWQERQRFAEGLAKYGTDDLIQMLITGAATRGGEPNATISLAGLTRGRGPDAFIKNTPTIGRAAESPDPGIGLER